MNLYKNLLSTAILVVLSALAMPIFAQPEEESLAQTRENALAFFQEGNFKKAIPEFNKVLKANSKDYDIYGKRGIALMWDGQTDQASKDLKLATENTTDAIYFFYYANLLPYEDFVGKIKVLDQAIELDANNARYFYQRGRLKMKVIKAQRDGSETVDIAALEQELGVSLDVCQDMTKAASIDNQYQQKATANCNNFRN